MTKTDILAVFIVAFVAEHSAMPTLLVLMDLLKAPMNVVMAHLDMLIHRGVLVRGRNSSSSSYLLYPGLFGVQRVSLAQAVEDAPAAA